MLEQYCSGKNNGRGTFMYYRPWDDDKGVSFLDDQKVLASTEAELIEFVQIVRIFEEKCDMKINVNKAKVMQVSRNVWMPMNM